MTARTLVEIDEPTLRRMAEGHAVVESGGRVYLTIAATTFVAEIEAVAS